MLNPGFDRHQKPCHLASADNLPQINLSADITGRESDSSAPQSGDASGDSEVTSYGFNITLTQNIYNADTIAGIDIAEAEVA